MAIPKTEAETHSDSFADAYRGAGESLYRLALAICGDRPAAEDVVQEAFVRVWRRRGRLRDSSRLTGYLYRTVRNLARDHRRRLESRGKALEGVAGLLRPASGREDGPDAERISKALFALPVEQREVVFLRVYEGLPFKDLAERVDAPLATVHSRFRYAMERLRTLLEVPHGQ